MSAGRRGGPLRFLGTTVGAWIGLRIAIAALMPAPAILPIAARASSPPRRAVPAPAPHGASAAPEVPAALPQPRVIARSGRMDLLPPAPPADAATLALATDQRVDGAVPRGAGVPPAEAFAAPPAVDGVPEPGLWSAQAWLFVRGGPMRAVAPGGQLGGGQAGVRAVRQLGSHAALAARMSVPTGDARGAEAAAGLDWLPFGAGTPVRVSVERRVALGSRARDAWSAYAAAGFYSAFDAGFVVDGYAQAGVVGARRRDLFADGALRAGRRIARRGDARLTLGVGAWGAAQPGAERLDVGPRVALSLPVAAAATAVLALEGRIRVAGGARPGPGVALTLASDF